MNVFVSRDANGAINGVYARPQPGHAEEELPSDNAEVVAFMTAFNEAMRP